MNEWTFALILALMVSYFLIEKAIESWKEVQLAKYTTDFEIEFEEDEDASTNTRESSDTNGQ